MIESSRNSSSLAVLAMLLLGPTFSWAHHGWSGYSSDIDTSLVVTKLRLGNPHDQLIATDSEGQEWNLVLATPDRNRYLGNFFSLNRYATNRM